MIPKVDEAGEIVPTASTTSQLALGDALSIATMKYKKFGKMDFKKLHPAGSLGSQLKTVEDIYDYWLKKFHLLMKTCK